MLDVIARKMAFYGLLLAFCTLFAHAAVITYSDGFESPTIDPFWTVTQSYGTVTASSDLSHSGSQSAKFESVSGGQRVMQLVHNFATPVQGTFSVWFYDNAPNQQTLYEYIVLSNSSQPGLGASLGTQDFDAYCYAAASDGSGPNGTCGSYPQATTTTVPRTAGWHQFTLDVTALAVTLGIDGNQVHSNPVNDSFDTLTINVSGPFWRPNTTAFFDDFNMRATTSETPEPATAFLLAPALAACLLMRRGARRQR